MRALFRRQEQSAIGLQPGAVSPHEPIAFLDGDVSAAKVTSPLSAFSKSRWLAGEQR